MINITYNFSANLKEILGKIEVLRRTILLTPINPKTEARLRFEAMLNRAYWSLNLTDSPLAKSDLLKFFTRGNVKKMTLQEKEALQYKKALDYISYEWLVVERPIKVKNILELHEMLTKGKLKVSENSIKTALDYLQVTADNPVIQSGLAYVQMANIVPFSYDNQRFCSLIAYLFLYKRGYDFKGLLVLEKYWKKTMMDFNNYLQTALQNSTVTLWLEYFSKSVEQSLEEIALNLSSFQNRPQPSSSMWELNDRQKEIMSLLEAPNQTITNKKVQKLFKISQITSSRDLAKLTTLGLLLAHGKGRSIYYTKA